MLSKGSPSGAWSIAIQGWFALQGAALAQLTNCLWLIRCRYKLIKMAPDKARRLTHIFLASSKKLYLSPSFCFNKCLLRNSEVTIYIKKMATSCARNVLDDYDTDRRSSLRSTKHKEIDVIVLESYGNLVINGKTGGKMNARITDTTLYVIGVTKVAAVGG